MRTRSHEPIVWSLFGAGGVFAALLGTMLVLIIGILVPMGLGFGPDAMHYDTLRSL
ncbi:fumarate reductase subunit D, partial [Ectothiorhodospira sp. B14B]|nr:fumarate reductase subunit D [Ectothiorhodospira lacustris]